MGKQITIRVDLMSYDAGTCPMCEFDSLRRVVGYQITPRGVGTLVQQTICGRCINELRESVDP